MGMGDIPTLEDLERELGSLDGRRILVRTDFNVPLDGATITDDFRIRAGAAHAELADRSRSPRRHRQSPRPAEGRAGRALLDGAGARAAG